jgi:RNA polymerase sigma-70 factor (ECF subfamily)
MGIAETASLTTTRAAHADFVDRLKQFEAAAWNELYDAYSTRLYRYLFIRVGDPEAAEELTAQVFEEACRRIGSYRFRGPPISAWLYKVAYNRMVDWKRKRKPLPLAVDVAAPDRMTEVADRDELARAMDALTEDQQQVLVLRHIEGHSSASAGEIMGKNAGAVRALEFRALSSLRRHLSRAEGGMITT